MQTLPPANGVPVIDLAPAFGPDSAAQRAVAKAVDAACREWGFLIITGHGVAPGLLTEMDRATRTFFDLPLEERVRCELPRALSSRGYRRFAKGANGRLLGVEAPPDLRESFRMGPEFPAGAAIAIAPEDRRFFGPNVWPDTPAEMRAVWEAYYLALDALARGMMHIFADALALPRTWFDDKVDRGASEMVAQHYPALEVAPLPGQFRNHAHTDFGNITILKSEDRPNGLQVADRSGDWHEVIPVAGTFIVNIGDMLAQWTNDRWRSTMHRVVNPAGDSDRRLSIAFFHEPNPDAMIETIPSCIDAQHPSKYAAVRAGAYFAEKLDLVQGVTAMS